MTKIRILQLDVVDEQPREVFVEDKLETYQKIVGGYLEAVQFHSDIVMWLNEEGLLIELPHNFETVVVQNGVIRPVHHIVGNVFFSSKDDEGNTTSLSDYQIDLIRNMFKHSRKACVVR